MAHRLIKTRSASQLFLCVRGTLARFPQSLSKRFLLSHVFASKAKTFLALLLLFTKSFLVRGGL